MSSAVADLTTASAPYIEAVEAEMRAILHNDEARLAPFYGMLSYHMGWTDEAFRPIQARTGKRLRPIYCLLACEALGGDWVQAAPAAAAIELTHNFSLIHDDVEDGDRERHGRPTLWARWGQPQAINAGDGLFVLARLGLWRLVDRGVAAHTVAAVGQVYDRACLAITEGQFLDMQFEDRLEVTTDDYVRMISGKTAALLAAATQTGALLAGAPAPVVEGMWRFGQAVGLAFQTRDDYLGIWGDEGLTGKRAANDIRRRKKSLPVAYALERAAGPAQAKLRQVYTQPMLDEDDVAVVLEILEGCGARRHTEQLTDHYLEQAMAEITPYQRTAAGETLALLTGSLARRTF